MKLLKQGQIRELKKSRYYLTEEGIIVTKGTLQIFPELEKYRKPKKKTFFSGGTKIF
jgi:hypothetical protein